MFKEVLCSRLLSSYQNTLFCVLFFGGFSFFSDVFSTSHWASLELFNGWCYGPFCPTSVYVYTDRNHSPTRRRKRIGICFLSVQTNFHSKFRLCLRLRKQVSDSCGVSHFPPLARPPLAKSRHAPSRHLTCQSLLLRSSLSPHPCCLLHPLSTHPQAGGGRLSE